MKTGRFMAKVRKAFRYGEKGFTLIELLIVVAILGILAAVVIPNVGTFLESGNIGAARAEMSTLQVAVDGMMADAGVTALAADVTGWQGGNEVTATSAGGTDYFASDYIRRTVTGEYTVYTTGIVECTAYGALDAAAINKVNNP